MPNEVAQQKLDSLARCLKRLHEKTPASLEQLVRETDLQDIIMLNLERTVQLSVDLAMILIAENNWDPVPSTMAGAFDTLAAHAALSPSLCERMKKSVGFRNICVHEYDKINWEIVYKILTLHLQDFKEFARIVNQMK